MGAQQSRSGKGGKVQTSKLSSEEVASMKDGFESLCKNLPKCDEALFMRHVKNSWEESLATVVTTSLGLKRGPDGSVGLKEFQAFGNVLLSKSSDDQAQLVGQLCKNPETGNVSVDDLRQFVEKLFLSFMIARSSRAETSWFDSDAGLRVFALALTHSVGDDESRLLTTDDLRSWLGANPLIIRLLNAVIRWFLFLPTSSLSDSADEEAASDVFSSCGIIPSCEHPYLPKARFPTLLALPNVALLNSELPVELRHQWRFVYSSYLQGDSFTGLVKAVIDRGPTILVVKERGTDEVFGGFASSSWKVSPNWQGTNLSFTFTLKPKLGVYRTTGYNDHYMYLNLGQETLPNGLGMGGQLEYFGFWLDADFGKGFAAPSCTTFSAPRLCSTERFEVDVVEVWGVGPEPRKPEERQSILDVDPGAKALLEMAGRSQHSEGIRETATADSPEIKHLQ